MSCLRILHLEDSALDSELIQAHLEEAGLEMEFRRVDTRAEFEAAVCSSTDLVLSDYKLPQFDALEALALVREHCPELPFIFVTGALGEELAIETLKRGATDYVLKDRLGRLVPAVRRALREADERRERRRAEESLRESEDRFRLMAETVPSLLFTTTPQGECDYVNQRFYDYTGLPQGCELAREWPQAVHPDDLPVIDTRWKHSLDVGVPFECEYRLRGADGGYRWFVARSRPVRDGQGQITKWFGVATDIEDQKRTEAALRDSESRLRRLVESNIISVVLSNEAGRIYEANTAFLEMVGYTREDLLAGRIDWKELTPPEWTTRDQFAIAEAKVRGACTAFEKEYIRKDGTRIPILIGFAKLEHSEADYICFILDLSNLKAAEAARTASEARIRGILETAADGIITIDEQETIESVNPAASRMFGYASAELVGQNIRVLMPELFQSRHDSYLDHYRRTGERRIIGTGREVQGRRKDGTVFPVDLSVSEVPIQGRRIFTGIVRDITERKAAAQELEAARDAAQAANRAKSDFLANVSHELRTPMNAILGMTELALDEELSPTVRDYLQTVQDSAGHLLQLLNELLDFSKMEAGRFDFEAAPFSLREVLSETLRPLSVQAFEKGLELACHVLNDVPDSLVGDRQRLRQIVTNLVGNGIKFTEQGEVELQVEAESRTSDDVSLRFSVRDTGIGISAADQQKIFAPFVQVDSTSTRNYMGTGLGLAIAAELVSRMGGRIWVESTPGQGSVFHFTARFLYHTNGQETSGQFDRLKQELGGLRVLVVDDNATNRRILQDTLANFAMPATVFERGRDALDALRAAAERGEPFQLAIIDALMPQMDGFMLVEEIQRHPQLRTTPVLMLSSADRYTMRQRMASLPVAAFLEKPVSQPELLEVIAAALHGPPPAAGPRRRFQPPLPQRPLHVLVAEDRPANQKLVVTILRKHGHTVEVAETGTEAVEKATGGHFDLILMDVQMPGMDGFQATAAIRARERSPHHRIPIIAMTAHAMKGDRERCLAAGMDAYIAKPLDSRKLIELVESLSARGTESTGLPSAASPTVATEDRPPSSEEPIAMEKDDHPSAAHEPAVFDYQSALERIGGDRSLFQSIVQIFFEDLPGQIAELKSAASDRDAGRLKHAAHSLKGLVATFSAHSAVEAARAIEHAATTDGAAAAAPGVPRLEAELNRLQEALRPYAEGVAI